MNFTYLRSFAVLFIGLFVAFMYQSCSTCSRPTVVVEDVDFSDIDADMLFFDVSQRVLYNMHTPIEASMLIKNWGVPYPELLSDPANASAYLTKYKQALNLGVYITDMTTAAIYEQTQTVLRYREALMTLIESLGLQAVATNEVIQKIEDNINNKNVLLETISSIYASAFEFLSADDRDFYVLAILTGSWVEGMYIATNVIDETKAEDKQKSINVITENKTTFDLLWQALSQIDRIPEDAAYLMLDMSYIAHLFGNETLISESLPARNPNSNIENITPQFFAEVKEHVRVLRQHFIRK
jgi:hypothetical protein